MESSVEIIIEDASVPPVTEAVEPQTAAASINETTKDALIEPDCKFPKPHAANAGIETTQATIDGFEFSVADAIVKTVEPSICNPCTCDADSFKVTVKFKLDDNHIIAQVYDNQCLLGDMLLDLAAKFKIDRQYMQLQHEYIELKDEQRLSELPTNEFSIVELDLSLNARADTFNTKCRRRHELLRLNPEIFYEHYHLPELLMVHIADDKDRNLVAKRLIVEIVSKPIVKSFVGGFRDSRTNIEYHDAFTQTGPHADSIKYSGIMSRPTQTICVKNREDDTHYDRSNQTFGSASKLIYVPAASDYTIEPKPYESYDEMVRRINKLGKIILIQRNFRRYMIQKLIRESAAEYRRLYKLQMANEDIREKRLQNTYKKECVIKTFPKSREDFNLLVVQIHKWKMGEVAKINDLAWGAPKIAMLHAVLDKEIQLLNSIERNWFALRLQKTAERTERKLDEMGKPVKWVGYKSASNVIAVFFGIIFERFYLQTLVLFINAVVDVVCEMDLLRTQKIRFLVSMYREMKHPVRSKEKRMELINRVCDILQGEKDTKSRSELIQLLLREHNLLSCHIKGDTLTPLRLRQLRFMVDIIESYDRVVESIPCNDDKTRLMCKQCKAVRPVADFQMNTRQKEVNVCTSCTLLKYPPTDFTIYREILRSVQRDERRRGALTSFAFIACDNDIRELVDVIWHGHSVLSQNSEHAELRLPRWRKGDDWSPWNCVCLTEEEARAHVKLKNLEDLYDGALMAQVERKHSSARFMFKKMDLVNRDYVESKEWWLAGLNGTVV